MSSPVASPKPGVPVEVCVYQNATPLTRPGIRYNADIRPNTTTKLNMPDAIRSTDSWFLDLQWEKDSPWVGWRLFIASFHDMFGSPVTVHTPGLLFMNRTDIPSVTFMVPRPAGPYNLAPFILVMRLWTWMDEEK